MLKSPLRYPGGKSRAVQQIMRLLPNGFEEYREPFVGGGSFFIYLRQVYPSLRFWINDLNPELFYFWKQAQEDSEKLAKEILRVKCKRTDGQKLFNDLVAVKTENLTGLERAVRFFILNRITFSGVVEAGGYSQLAFRSRFTESSILRVARLGRLLEGVKITNLDYRQVLASGGGEIFTFLDPPYFKATKSRLYGKNGVLHTTFDHGEFAERMKSCRHLWLVTYDDSPEVRENFKFANIYGWKLQYGMNNYRQGRATPGHELFIANYPLPIPLESRVAEERLPKQLRLI
ncbi:MAG: DNA adenine methylase [Chloracidobacterium sp.]|nr:DNA adenine methylase [Chloracidobacterium sp.]MDW8217100.1 DNA adenine methylase [Acidobacteriota bacterium]